MDAKEFVSIKNIYFGGWGWATFFDFFLIPRVGKLNLIFPGRQGEGGNENQCVKPLVTNCWSTNIDKCKGLVVLLFCMNNSNLSHKACLSLGNTIIAA